MPRELSLQDISLLKKMAPECSDLTCTGSGYPFRSLLPPLANHFALEENDFANRIDRLSDDELEYLLSLIRDGRESMGCVPPEYASVFIELVSKRLGAGPASEILEIYEQSLQCPD